jgi:2',3'-cyclic-nucleotide 2'-phosphodiesterase (5'-nucleotidase family)
MRIGMKFFRSILFISVIGLGPAVYAQQGVVTPAPKSSQATKPAHAAPSAVTITLLSTTDSHGHLAAWDYYTDKAVPNGLTKMATLVKQQRADAPHALLLDCGDTTQGTPLVYYFAKKGATKPNPAIAAFDAMHYDAMAVGNHEFNFGLDSMWKAKRESHFPWLAANLKQIYTAGVAYIPPWMACVWELSASSRRECRAGKFRIIIEAMSLSRLWRRQRRLCLWSGKRRTSSS